MTIPPIPARPPPSVRRFDATRLAKRVSQSQEITGQHRVGTVNTVNTDGTVDVDLAGTVIPDVPTVGGVTVGGSVQLLVWQGDLLALATTGYGLRDIITFPTAGSFSFDHGDYPWLRAVLVRLVGGGGGSGGCDSTGPNQNAIGRSGSGAVYAERLIPVASLAPSEPVTVGAGGTAGAAGNNAGGTGGTSSFGALVSAAGGVGGVGGSAGGVRAYGLPGSTLGPTTGTGDLVIPGGPSGFIIYDIVSVAANARGGDSHLGLGAPILTTVGSTAGAAGGLYGGGASGGVAAQNSAAREGNVGGRGIVICSLYG